ncbi:MAG: TIGR02253 family HAD-type hydrolase [Candidatus Micrarchaeia archaeon]|jgi:putative hydrolase of the HAD superfamily
MFKAILFDLDNTLLDFLTFKKETAKAAAKAMVKQGLPATETEAYGKIFSVYDEKGIEYQKTFYEVVKQYDLEVNLAEKIQQAGILAYLQKKFEVLKPYPMVKPTLKELRKRGLKLGIVSDAPRNKAWQRLILAGLENEFDFVITHSDTQEFKPHPSPFTLALKTLGVLPDAVLFVGDNPSRDIKGAKAVGMRTCLAKYGQTFKEDVKADYEIEKFENIIKLIRLGE